ncbi:MAG: hypothetical protein M0D55_14820 [Elusimicrobiota bacterium]|nr:MAG: hypothetical protein M0D55_14820 [Elusimicrobiota bacterium]
MRRPLGRPLRANDEEGEEQKPDDGAAEISAPEPATTRPGRQPFSTPATRRNTPNPASGASSGGGGGVIATDNAPAGISQGAADSRPAREFTRDLAGAAPAAPAGDGAFQEIDIGLLPTIAQIRGSGGDRPVIKLGGGQKWAIRMKHKGPGRAVFPMMIGGTNGDLTGGGKYNYKAAISKTKGSLTGASPACTGGMTNAAYVTCQMPCNMQWNLAFGTPAKDRAKNGLCELDNDTVYYLNIAPVGNGCTGGQAEGFGCPIVMEAANGGTLYLNPGGPGPACRHRGFGYDPNRGCVQ